MKYKRKGTHCKAFQQTQTSPLTEHPLFFSLDEKNFNQNQMVNSHKNHWVSLSSQDISILMKTKHPVHIMGFRMVTNNGDIMLPFIFPWRPTQEKVVLPWIKRVAAGRHYIWQQDYHMLHKQENLVMTVRKFLLHHLLDYYMWDVIKCEANKTWCNTKDELKSRTMAAFTNLNKEPTGRICRKF